RVLDHVGASLDAERGDVQALGQLAREVAVTGTEVDDAPGARGPLGGERAERGHLVALSIARPPERARLGREDDGLERREGDDLAREGAQRGRGVAVLEEHARGLSVLGALERRVVEGEEERGPPAALAPRGRS